MYKCGICGHFNCVAGYFPHPTDPFSNIDHPYIIGKDCMYEDELPDMTDEDYSEWFRASAIVDGVRMGPAYPPNTTNRQPARDNDLDCPQEHK